MRKRSLGKAVEPSLMVKKDGLILEKNLRFKEALVVFRRFKKLLLFFSNVKEVLVGFQKTSLALREVFRKPFLSPIS